MFAYTLYNFNKCNKMKQAFTRCIVYKIYMYLLIHEKLNLLSIVSNTFLFWMYGIKKWKFENNGFLVSNLFMGEKIHYFKDGLLNSRLF